VLEADDEPPWLALELDEPPPPHAAAAATAKATPVRIFEGMCMDGCLLLDLRILVEKRTGRARSVPFRPTAGEAAL
jgi:hypothetical protein